MWVKTYDSSGNESGRINLDNVSRIEVVSAGGSWEIKAYPVTATTNLSVASAPFATRADAMGAIDELLVNGS